MLVPTWGGEEGGVRIYFDEGRKKLDADAAGRRLPLVLNLTPLPSPCWAFILKAAEWNEAGCIDND